MLTTKLYVIEPGLAPRLMNEITPFSRFKSIPNAETRTEEGQLAVAKDLRNGWRNANHFPIGTKFEIVQEGVV